MKILYSPHEYSQQRQHQKKRWIYPVLLAMQATYYRDMGYRVVWDAPCSDADRVVTEPEAIDFLKLPAPDRLLTNAFAKKYQANGNFKFHPATYIQVADGCWWGKCSFCVEKHRGWKVRDPFKVVEELRGIKALGFKEAFDDSGTFPIGPWLDEFLGAYQGSSIRLTLGCNMRMVHVDYRRMKQAGFRMMLFGIESASQRTLDRIHKGTHVLDVGYVREAARAGIECHGAFMVGYPWETEEDAAKTLELCHGLLKDGTLKTAQMSVYSVQGVENNDGHRKYMDRLYSVAWSPAFWWHQLRGLKTKADVKYLARKIYEGVRK